jgi:hypothetical protein
MVPGGGGMTNTLPTPPPAKDSGVSAETGTGGAPDALPPGSGAAPTAADSGDLSPLDASDAL